MQKLLTAPDMWEEIEKTSNLLSHGDTFRKKQRQLFFKLSIIYYSWIYNNIYIKKQTFFHKFKSLSLSLFKSGNFIVIFYVYNFPILYV